MTARITNPRQWGNNASANISEAFHQRSILTTQAYWITLFRPNVISVKKTGAWCVKKQNSVRAKGTGSSTHDKERASLFCFSRKHQFLAWSHSGLVPIPIGIVSFQCFSVGPGSYRDVTIIQSKLSNHLCTIPALQLFGIRCITTITNINNNERYKRSTIYHSPG